MRYFRLVIAGYRIGFRADSDGPGLAVSKRFLNYLDNDPACDIIITVHPGNCIMPEASEMVFRAPSCIFTGEMTENGSELWSIWKANDSLFIKTESLLSSCNRPSCLMFSLSDTVWNLWTGENDKNSEPAEYPLDGLILYYLTAIKGDIMIHASGVNKDGKGYLFSGISGRGKSTMAGIWAAGGATVIHDDRLIIKKQGDGYFMFNTPVYEDDRPLSAPLTKIFLIEHGQENTALPIKGSGAAGRLLANCIQHSWNSSLIARLMNSVNGLCEKIPVSRLSFKPDKSVMDLILRDND